MMTLPRLRLSDRRHLSIDAGPLTLIVGLNTSRQAFTQPVRARTNCYAATVGGHDALLRVGPFAALIDHSPGRTPRP